MWTLVSSVEIRPCGVRLLALEQNIASQFKYFRLVAYESNSLQTWLVVPDSQKYFHISMHCHSLAATRGRKHFQKLVCVRKIHRSHMKIIYKNGNPCSLLCRPVFISNSNCTAISSTLFLSDLSTYAVGSRSFLLETTKEWLFHILYFSRSTNTYLQIKVLLFLNIFKYT